MAHDEHRTRICGEKIAVKFLKAGAGEPVLLPRPYALALGLRTRHFSNGGIRDFNGDKGTLISIISIGRYNDQDDLYRKK
jgi:hypothetical protein